MVRDGIHNYDKRIACSLRRLERSRVSGSNRLVILRFFDYLRAMGMSKARIERYLQTLKLFGELVTKDFKELSKDDVVALIGVIEGRELMDKEQVYKELEKLHYLKSKCTKKWQLELIYFKIETLIDLLERKYGLSLFKKLI